MSSIAEGLANKKGYEPAQTILRAMLYDFILVSDEDIETSDKEDEWKDGGVWPNILEF